MIDKVTYLQLKREIKCLCRANVVKLADDMELNAEDKELLLAFHNGDTRTKVCYDMSISTEYYRNHMKLLFSKIYDYKNTFC